MIVRDYIIEQTRQIKVSANDPVTALVLAEQAFDANSSTGTIDTTGRPITPIRTTSVNVREDY